MHDLIWLNGEVIGLDAARLSPASAGALFGWGVFTTLGVRDGRARLFDHHWRRLSAHAERVGVRHSWDAGGVEAGLAELVASANLGNGRARVTLLRGRAGLWQEARARESDLLVFVAPLEERPARPFALTVSPYRVNTSSPLVGIKSTSYAAHLLALEEARAREFDEAIMLNERGEIAEATAANVFWVRDGELFTPSLATGCLAGVTRRLVLDAAAGRRMRVTEGSFTLAALGEADEVFLTNSTWGVRPVGQFDIHEYGAAPTSARLAALADGLADAPGGDAANP